MASTGKLSTYYVNKLLDKAFGATDFTPPATVYFALFTVVPTVGNTGGTEVSTNNYSRASIANNATTFPAASAGAKATGVTVSFPSPSGSWGTILGIGIYDASSGGNLLAVSTLSAGVPVASGDPVTVNSGDLSLSVS